MGIQAMASQSGGGGPQSLIPSLSRQGSIYSLTLNEVQNHLGEPLNSMNLDELLKSVLPDDADACLAMNPAGASGYHGSGPGVRRQGSVRKTVDEVWRDIQKVENKNNGEWASGRERQPTLGEMTLEDFLVKAGVVIEVIDNPVGNVGVSCDPAAAVEGFTPRAHWLQQYHQIHQQQQQAQQSLMGTMSDPQTPRQKRGASEDVAEKGVERRQKRMIKNRESAARSRARKQAYMNELENKISHLEQENERLKKHKELDTVLVGYIPLPEPKHQLRRSSSSPF